MRFFHRPTARPNADDRLILTIALLENGPRPARALRTLFAWAADPENAETLELVLDGGLVVDVSSEGEVVLACRIGEASWMCGVEAEGVMA